MLGSLTLAAFLVLCASIGNDFQFSVIADSSFIKGVTMRSDSTILSEDGLCLWLHVVLTKNAVSRRSKVGVKGYWGRTGEVELGDRGSWRDGGNVVHFSFYRVHFYRSKVGRLD